jgi:four helix bundle protein
MSGKSFRELTVWQDSVALIKAVYRLAETLPKSEEYNLKQQLKRAAVSVALNIAEGKNRKTTKDFANFLTISAASLAEVEAVLAICEELQYLDNLDEMYADIGKLGRMLNSLKSKLKTKDGA